MLFCNFSAWPDSGAGSSGPVCRGPLAKQVVHDVGSLEDAPVSSRAVLLRLGRIIQSYLGILEVLYSDYLRIQEV